MILLSFIFVLCPGSNVLVPIISVMYIKFNENALKVLKKKLIYSYLSRVFEMLNLRLLGNIFDLQILLGERSGTFRESARLGLYDREWRTA